MIILLHVGRQFRTRLDAHGIYPKLRLLLRFHLWEGSLESLQSFLLHILALLGVDCWLLFHQYDVIRSARQINGVLFQWYT